MKLALLSDHSTEIGKLAIQKITDSVASDHRKVSYIASSPDPERIYFNEVRELYSGLGLHMNDYLDFESGFSEARFNKALQNPVLHLSGGNTFQFLQNLNPRKVRESIASYVKQGGIVIGVSAGAILLTPDISSAVLCGDMNDVGIASYAGLSIFPGYFAPHATFSGEEKEQAIQWLSSQPSMSLYLASNDDAIIYENGDITLLGNPLVLDS